jgi:hypothetical protein
MKHVINMSLFEKRLSTFNKEISIRVEVGMTTHSQERQSRHGDDNKITEEDIEKTAKDAIPRISKHLMFNDIDIGDDVLIVNRDLNLICNLAEENNSLVLIIVTVMRKWDFKPKHGTYKIVL